MRLRPAVPDDVAAVARVDAEAFGADAWSATLLRDLVDADLARGELVLAVAADGGLLGYAVLSAVGEDAELQRIAVLPAARRRGVAGALLAAGRDRVRRAGATRLLLEVRADNAAALALYAGEGFAEIGRRPRYYRDGTTAVILEHPIDVTMEA
ncbi:ribosomal protein S18-alanine N-acetyltransferase [Nocardioides sambongensis]|uniref:ribosomal protein S18-alanine N-acetyltransferase n=1 Tax=Nocardioides sambongensis TaxID=2589074 RepID=UPI00112CDB1A|nr:ribosomal protein S18-alanine N-acetyltransferase [Nocardioides sambongensis]